MLSGAVGEDDHKAVSACERGDIDNDSTKLVQKNILVNTDVGSC